jgi:maleylpyruvate isomerase
MSEAALDTAREELRRRQGAGARHDAAEAPHEALLEARLASAFFARKLNELQDDELFVRPRHVSVTRASIICDVSYNARALCFQFEAQEDEELPAITSAESLAAEIELGSCLPARAIRHLFSHTAKHLDVAWRDLPGQSWNDEVKGLDGVIRPLRKTPEERAHRLWRGTLQLGNGTRLKDIPSQFRNSIVSNGMTK